MKIEFNQRISTYWWNYGSKKNDFNGSVNDFFKEKNVKVTKLKGTEKLRFKFNMGSSSFQIDSTDYPNDAALTIIKIFLTYLGDKAQIKTGSRTININF